MTEDNIQRIINEGKLTPELRNELKDEWYKAFERWQKEQDNNFIQLIAFSSAAMKAPSLAAAGGIAATLGFYSANYSHLKDLPDHLSFFNSVIILWAAALMISVIAPGIAYLSQSMFVFAGNFEIYNIKKMTMVQTENSKWYCKIGNMLRFLLMFFIGISYLFLIVGGYYFVCLINF